MNRIKEENSKNATVQSALMAADPVGHPGSKAPWSTPTLTRLPGEETEVQPSFGIVNLILAGS